MKVFEILPDFNIAQSIYYPTIEQITSSNLLDLSNIKIGLKFYSINTKFGDKDMSKIGEDKDKIVDLIDINQLVETQRIKKIIFRNKLFRK